MQIRFLQENGFNVMLQSEQEHLENLYLLSMPSTSTIVYECPKNPGFKIACGLFPKFNQVFVRSRTIYCNNLI